MDPCQRFTIGPKALQGALLMIPEGLSGAKKRHSNRLKLFGCIAVATRTILLVYREGNLGQWITSVANPWEKERPNSGGQGATRGATCELMSG